MFVRVLCHPVALNCVLLVINWITAPCCCRDPYEDARRERLTTSDALSYLREVKTRFANNRRVYDR